MVMIAWNNTDDPITSMVPINTMQSESTVGTASVMVNSNSSVHITLQGGLCCISSFKQYLHLMFKSNEKAYFDPGEDEPSAIIHFY